MNKPITVARQDFIQDIVGLINASGLPAFLIIEILKDCIKEMEPIAESQYKTDLENYQESLQKDMEEGNGNMEH